MNVPPSKKAKVYIACQEEVVFTKGKDFIKKLAYASEVEIANNFEIDSAVNIITNSAKIYIPMDELIDKKAELQRLRKELESADKKFKQCSGKLNNQGFLSKAPSDVIEKVKEDAKNLQDKIDMLNSTISKLEN